MESKKFKNWTIPGPVPPDQDVELNAGETLDALSGHFKIFQKKDGHRFSSDDVLTAWYGTICCPSAHRVLDLGSGIGSVAMIAAWRLPGAQFVTIEAQEESYHLAKKSVALNGLSERFRLLQGDLRDLTPDPRFDLVLGSPPYFPLESGKQSSVSQKKACRFEMRGDVLDYCMAAAKNLAPGGVFSLVFPINPIQQKKRVIQAAKASGLCIYRMLPIRFKASQKPLIGLFSMMNKDDLPPELQSKPWIEPSLCIRNKEGQISHAYRAIKMSFGFHP